jgi:hypothetical protein
METNAETQMVKQGNCFDVQLKIERKLGKEDCELIERKIGNFSEKKAAFGERHMKVMYCYGLTIYTINFC